MEHPLKINASQFILQLLTYFQSIHLSNNLFKIIMITKIIMRMILFSFDDKILLDSGFWRFDDFILEVLGLVVDCSNSGLIFLYSN